MKKLLLPLLLIVIQLNNVFAQTTSPTCITATPICASTTNSYPAGTGSGNYAQAGPNYGCMVSQPNPSWFYFKIDSPGEIVININQNTIGGTGVDVDFICWGPFTDAATPCSGQLTASKIQDCSYSTAFSETLNVDSTLTGEYYIMLITNFANISATATLTVDASSTATLSCEETCTTHPDYNNPVCVNGTLQLYSTSHFGLGTYNWTGPAGFTATGQNPTLAGATGTNSGYYYVNYVRDSTCNTLDSVYVQVDTCGSITGHVYADQNMNCLRDSVENPIANVQVKLTQAGSFVSFAWTDIFGYYYFDVLPGTYTIEVDPTPNLPITCSSSLSHTTTVMASVINTEDFAIDCNAVDVAASAISVAGVPFFPGQTNYMFPMIASLGPDCNSTPIPGQFQLVLDPLVTFSGVLSSATYGTPSLTTAPTGDTLKWNIPNVTDLDNWGYYDFAFNYLTSASAVIGDTVRFKMIVYPFVGDVNTANNIHERYFIVGNSYDPNAKEVSPAGTGIQGFIPAATPKLEYMIHFQNTGTAPAHDIYILDTLDSDVDILSLEIIASSHPQTTTLLPGNVLKFMFSNIMLPDSTNFESQSHGFVKYSIAPKPGLNPGDQITNTGYIYFDLNPPIVTNTALNTIEFPTGIVEKGEYQLDVFPNPANNLLNIVFQDKVSKSVGFRLLNVSGQSIAEEQASGFNGRYNKTIDLSTYPKGVYLLEIRTDQQVIHKKVVKN